MIPEPDRAAVLREAADTLTRRYQHAVGRAERQGTVVRALLDWADGKGGALWRLFPLRHGLQAASEWLSVPGALRRAAWVVRHELPDDERSAVVRGRWATRFTELAADLATDELAGRQVKSEPVVERSGPPAVGGA